MFTFIGFLSCVCKELENLKAFPHFLCSWGFSGLGVLSYLQGPECLAAFFTLIGFLSLCGLVHIFEVEELKVFPHTLPL